MEKITGEVKFKNERIIQIKNAIKNIIDLGKEIEANLTKEITQILEICLAGSIVLDASDIHIEKEEKKAKMRIRTDGMLRDVFYFESPVYHGLLSRIKLLSKIKLNIIDRAQDGRFTVLFGQMPIEIRVSILPSEYGESIVMRTLNPESLIEIESLGVREDIFQVLEKEIQQPNGMIIVTGPTGCGKTTTLYAILKRIQSPEIKIITLEDPIEYHLKGINQTQVNAKKGYDFANGLRAIIRQDPDVILIGEIRDLETASVALQAAMTGHLVLTTLHANDAAGTIARLQALGEKTTNIAPAINLAIAQRLVRKVCKKCAVFSKISEQEIQFFKKELKRISKKTEVPKINAALKIPHAKAGGCENCNFSGYEGRIGLYEFFLNDSEIENFILKSVSISGLREMARKKGMVSIREDGLIRVIQGETTVEEINRVTMEE
jgi:type IV pilus assembly protein PilB